MNAITFTARCASCRALLHPSDGAWLSTDSGATCPASTGAVHAALPLAKPVRAGQHKPSKASIVVTQTFDAPLVVGQHVTGQTRIDGRIVQTFDGTYLGVRASEWDGVPVHFFIDGHMGETKQSSFAFPA